MIPGLGRSPGERERLPPPVFWPGGFQGLYRPWGHKESDTAEQLSLHFIHSQLQFPSPSVITSANRDSLPGEAFQTFSPKASGLLAVFMELAAGGFPLPSTKEHDGNKSHKGIVFQMSSSSPLL